LLSDCGTGVVTVYAVSDAVSVSRSPFSSLINRNDDNVVGLAAVDGAVAVFVFATAVLFV